jgi:hypothetical protein
MLTAIFQQFFILTLGTGNALYQSKFKTHNNFFPGIMQLRGADF